MKNTSIPSPKEDNRPVVHHGHLLQSPVWGELKSHFGWTPQHVQASDAAAQILFRRLPLGRTIAYIPKGPSIDWSNVEQCQALFAALHAEAKKQQAIFLKVEPDVWESNIKLVSPQQTQAPTQYLTQNEFIPADTIQPQASIVINISSDEDAILAAMKQKTRYNIRLAKKKGVTIRYGTEADIQMFYDLAQLTSARDGFGVHSLSYYQMAFKLFAPHQCALLIAEFEAEPLAALMVFSQGATAYYLYGASSNTHRNLMPTYLIQWEAICWAKTQSCSSYDLWGIPTADETTLEAEFTQRREGLWGVYRFKRGFGGHIVQSVGAFDYIYNPLLYKLYAWYRSRE